MIHNLLQNKCKTMSVLKMSRVKKMCKEGYIFIKTSNIIIIYKLKQ